MSAARVGEWVADFYERVDDVAAAHGVTKVEVRGDCCICVAGLEGAVPSIAFAAAAGEDGRGTQATRMLAFAAALHADLATLPAGSAAATATRMGVATGEASFLVGDGAAGRAFACVMGDAAELAAGMEAAAAPGAACVHRSTAERWAAEAAGRRPAPLACVGCTGRGRARAAVFDGAAAAFRRPAAPAPPPRGPPPAARLRMISSGPI